MYVIEHHGGRLHRDEASLIEEMKRADAEGKMGLSDKEIYKRVKDRYLALTALKTAKHKEVIQEIRKQYVYKIDRYPKNLTEAYDLLEHNAATVKQNNLDKNEKKWKKKGGDESTEVVQGAQYYQEKKGNNLVAETDGKKHNVKCYHCGSM